MTDVEKEKAALERGVAVSRVMTGMVEQYDKENKRLWTLVLALTVVAGIMGGCMAWAVTNAQRIATDAVSRALENIAEIGVVTEESTTVNQDTGEGNGNAIYQSGENASYTESDGED